MRHFYLILFTVITSATAIAQTSVDFDGVDDFIDCGNDPSLDITGTAITLEAWVYPTAFQAQIWQGNVVNKNDDSQSGYMLRVGGAGQVNFNFGSFGFWNELNSPAGVLALNTWYHIAGTYDGTTSRIFVNGVEVATANYSASIASSSNPLYLGEDPQYTGRYFSGRIDEVRVWNVARTGTEVMNDMNDEVCTTGSGLVAYYRFNDGVAGGNNLGQNTLTDDSGNGNTGTLNNFTNFGSTSNWVTGVPLGAGMTNTIVPVDACDSYTWSQNGQTYTTSGNYTEVLTGSTGCDSTVTLDLSIYSPNDVTTNQIACDSFTWNANGQTYYATTTVVENLTTSQGCPYQHTLNLTVNNGFDSIEYVTACAPYVWGVNGTSYTISGQYTETFSAANGCDSTIILNLTIAPNLTADITANTDGSLSTTFGGMVNWYDCDNDQVLSGETGTSFIPTSNGNYAVIVSDGGMSCPDTSNCLLVDYVGLNSVTMDAILVMTPNPTTGKIAISMSGAFDQVSLQIVDAQGKVVYASQLIENDTHIVDMKVEPGVYFVKATTPTNTFTERLVKL